jgi:hypothetical protein
VDIELFESEDIPQPPAKVKIERLTATAYPDGWRVRLGVDVTPFLERPNLEITVNAADGRSVVPISLSVIETMHHSMEFTIHIRGVTNPVGQYIAHAELYYGTIDQIQARAETPFDIVEPGKP